MATSKTTKAPVPPTYQILKAELDTVLNELQREDLDVDQALQHYQRGLELIRELQNYLQGAENQIKQLKASFAN